VEYDNIYLKQALGLGNFRPQSKEAIQKWFAVIMLAINYVRVALPYSKSLVKVPLANLIRQHRLVDSQNLLRFVLQQYAAPQQIEPVYRRCLQDCPGRLSDNGFLQMTIRRRTNLPSCFAMSSPSIFAVL